jgi:hypothetical protein
MRDCDEECISIATGGNGEGGITIDYSLIWAYQAPWAGWFADVESNSRSNDKVFTGDTSDTRANLTRLIKTRSSRVQDTTS